MRKGKGIEKAVAVGSGRAALTVLMLVCLPVTKTSVWLHWTGKEEDSPARPPTHLSIHLMCMVVY